MGKLLAALWPIQGFGHAALGHAGASQWYSLWSHVAGYPDQFASWAWMSPSLARELSRVMRRQTSTTEQYRIVGPVSGYRWYKVEATTWGAWWAARLVGWVYTSGPGFMRLSGALERTAGDTTLMRDTRMRLVT